MSRKSKHRILALDPGTRYLGYAVLDGDDLLYHGVRVLPKGASPAESIGAARATVLEIINHLQPTVIAIETFTGGRKSRINVQARVVTVIRRLGELRRLQVVGYAPPTIRKFVCGSGRAGKRDVSLVLVRRYPELRPYLVRECRWKERFHGHMFDAVAVGWLTEHRLGIEGSRWPS